MDNTKDGSDSFKYFPFLSYAPSGEAEGELVYCNKGRESDFQELDKMGISVKGRVVLLRGYSGNVSENNQAFDSSSSSLLESA